MTARRNDVRKIIEEVIKSRDVTYTELTNAVCEICNCKVALVKVALRELRRDGFVKKPGNFYLWDDEASSDEMNANVIVRSANECKLKINRFYWTSLLQLPIRPSSSS